VDGRRLAGRRARIAQFVKGSQKTDDGTFSELCGEEPCWPCAIPKCSRTPIRSVPMSLVRKTLWDNTLRVLSRAKAPRLYGAPLDKNDRSKAVEIVRRFRCTVACEVLRSGDDNGHRLRESSRNWIWMSCSVAPTARRFFKILFYRGDARPLSRSNRPSRGVAHRSAAAIEEDFEKAPSGWRHGAGHPIQLREDSRRR